MAAKTKLHKRNWAWAEDAAGAGTGGDDAAGFSGASTVVATFLLQCKENGLPADKYEHLMKALHELSRRKEVNVQDDHFDGDSTTVDMLAASGVMSLKQVAQLAKPAKVAKVKEFMSQAEVLDLFKERIMEDGELMTKTASAMIRPAVKGERVVTEVDGRVTSDIVVGDDTSWVVKAPTANQEEYVLNKAKFEANWNADGEAEPNMTDMMSDGSDKPSSPDIYKDIPGLTAQGFKLYSPQLVLKWLYQMKDADLDLAPSRNLKTEWGALQQIIVGDYLALPYPEAKASEIYIIPFSVTKAVYGPYEPGLSDEAEPGRSVVLGRADADGGEVTSRSAAMLLKTLRFDRSKRGDIAGDAQIVVRAFQEPFNLVFRYQMEEHVLVKWITAIAEQYNKVEYHSWVHGFDVFQFIYACLTRAGSDQYFQFQDILALLLGALCHDAAHIGRTNNFLISTQAELATKYNDKSPLENMHASVFFQTLQKPGLNFLQAMSPENFRSFRAKVVDSILATDMSHHFELIDKVSARVLEAKEHDKPIVIKSGDDTDANEVSESDLKMLLQSFMHMSDLGHCCRPFDIHKHIVVLLEEEFFKQGDAERERGMPISPMMDRTKDSAATSQSFFLTKLVLPLQTPWTYFVDETYRDMLFDNLEDNKTNWEALCLEHIKEGEQKKSAKEIIAIQDQGLS